MQMTFCAHIFFVVKVIVVIKMSSVCSPSFKSHVLGGVAEFRDNT